MMFYVSQVQEYSRPLYLPQTHMAGCTATPPADFHTVHHLVPKEGLARAEPNPTSRLPYGPPPCPQRGIGFHTVHHLVPKERLARAELLVCHVPKVFIDGTEGFALPLLREPCNQIAHWFVIGGGLALFFTKQPRLTFTKMHTMEKSGSVAV